MSTTTIAARIPATLAARLEQLAQRRRLTVSLLLRAMAERELDGDESDALGPIEATTRARLEQLLASDALDPRASVACELARRLDVDPSNGAQHSRELMRLLDDISRAVNGDEENCSVLDELRARRLLQSAGYGLTSPDGKVLTVSNREKSRSPGPADTLSTPNLPTARGGT